MQEFTRDVIRGEITLDYFARKLSEGWKVSAIEWSREGTGANAPADHAPIITADFALPFGLHLTDDKLIQENPLEATVLLIILEQIVREKRVHEIAAVLNQQGYLTRSGHPWTATEVFNLLPRVIDVGPSLLKSAAWQERRRTVQPNLEM